ncbi:MAG: hypothetical protein U0234_33040 [Sandaracinus sp.]
MGHVLLVVVALAGGLIGAIFLVGLWARRNESRPDRPGERSVVVFELESPVKVEAVFELMAARLRARGAVIGVASEPEAGRVGAVMKVDGKVAEYLTVARYEGLEADAWIAYAVDASGGGPPSRGSIAMLSDVVGELEGVSGVRWRTRSGLLHNAESVDFVAPFD